MLFRGRNYIHQLQVILNCLGTPSSKQMRFITYDEAKASIRAQGFKPRVPFSTLFPKASPMALDLLSKMLVFDPNGRCTVEEALAHPYLAEYHAATHEPLADLPFNFAWEAEEVGEGGRRGRIPKRVLQRLMLEEVAEFHPDVVPADIVPRNMQAGGRSGADGMDLGGAGGGMDAAAAAQQQGQTRADGRGDDDATAEAAIPVAPSPRILERAMEASNGGLRGRAGSNSRGRSTPRAGQPPPKRTQLAGDQSMYGGGWAGQRGGNGGAEEVEQGVANMAVVEEEPPRSRKQQENQAFVSMIEKSRQQQNQRRRERELQDDGGPANGGGGSPSRRTMTTPRGSQHP